jgi:hypothetical protein
MTRVCGRTVFRKILLIAVFALIFSITGCAGNATFSGSKTGNDQRFLGNPAGILRI